MGRKDKDDDYSYQDQGSADEPVQDVEEAEEPQDVAEGEVVQEEAAPEANVSTPQSDAAPRGDRERFPWEADPTADVES